MNLEPVAAGIDRWVMPEATMNAYVIASEGEALVVDPGTLPSRGRLLREAVEARGDRIVGTVVTHPHWDHFLALEAFAGIPTYAHVDAVEFIAEHPDEHRAAALADAGGDEEELHTLRVVAPEVPVTEAYTMLVGQQRVTLEPQPIAHTPADLTIRVEGVATITGDLLEVGADPQWDDSSDLDGWMRALDAIEAYDEPVLLPGHGERADATRIGHHRDLFVSVGATPTK